MFRGVTLTLVSVGYSGWASEAVEEGKALEEGKSKGTPKRRAAAGLEGAGASVRRRSA